MKRIITVLVLALLLFRAAYADVPPEIPVQAEAVYTTAASLPVDEYLPGDEVYFNIQINSDEVKGFEIVFDYTPELLEYKAVAVDTQKDSENDVVIVEKISNGSGLYALAVKGDNKLDTSKRLCTVTFTALNKGTAEFSLKSVKAVFDDMKYCINSDLTDIVSVKLGKEETQKPLGGGGGGGGGFAVKPKPAEDNKNETESKAEDETENKGDNENNEDESIKPENLKPVFCDVDKNFWGYSEITFLAENGIITGYSDNSFKPDKYVTRAEFAKMLICAARVDTSDDFVNSFADVSADAWYAKYAAAAAELNIFTGDENNNFKPDENITRQDCATAISRYIAKMQIAFPTVRENVIFADLDEVSDYAAEHVEALYKIGVINGDDGNFYPKNNITRAEAAVMLYRMVAG